MTVEFRLGNQQRHSITAVLLSAVVVIFGLVLVDMVSSPEPDPLGARTESVDAPPTSADVGASEAGEDLTAGVARSNARFTLNPEVTAVEAESSTTTTARGRTTAAVVTARMSTTTITTTATSTTTTTTEPPATSASSVTGSTTETTMVDPPKKPSTTVVDDATTTTKKCRGNRPGCRNP